MLYLALLILLVITMQYATDNALLEGLRKDEHAAWTQVYIQNRTAIFSMVLKNSGNEDDAADILQEGIIVLSEKVQDKDFKLTALLSTFLYRICYYKWLQVLRKNGDVPSEILGEEPADGPPEEDPREEQLRAMEKAMAELGESCQRILKYFYHKKLSMTEIALRVNLSNADTAKSKKSRCIRQLKDKMAA